MMASTQAHGSSGATLTNYCSYLKPNKKRTRIGSLSEDENSIQPLSYASGTPLSNLYEVIEAGEDRIIAAGEALDTSSVKLLAPISGRDVLCVGKNYASHATEFNKSGYDSSDKTDQPTHPVIFTKRFSSIIGHGDEIYPHEGFTETADYEGELGVIIGKSGFRISEAQAMDYVWGYTIINDMTARERQRDHKQFYIGKSPDTFCPMGPIAVPKDKVDAVMRVQTRVNGDLRQDQTTDDLIFSIPYLIMTLSEGQTLMPGDVLATGTPAGVGFGQEPPIFLKPGDEISVSITGLGTLKNRIAASESPNPAVERIKAEQTFALPHNALKAPNGAGLSIINDKPLHYVRAGKDNGSPMVFAHGLGGSLEFWTPIIDTAGSSSTHALHLYDFEGHGLSPTSPLSEITVESLAKDLKGVFDHASISEGATLVAHSLGCLVAVKFLLKNPKLVSKLILLGPPPSPLPEAGSKGSFARAALVRDAGMGGAVDTVVTAGTSERTRQSNPLAVAAIRLSLLGQDAEAYAKACAALAKSTNETLDFSGIQAETLIVTGSEDKISPPQLCEKYAAQITNSKGVQVLSEVGHWHSFEDSQGVAKAIAGFV